MTIPATSPSPPQLTSGQRDALVRLLEDEDPLVYEAVRDRILACGQEALTWLRPHALNADPTVRRRVHELTDFLARQRMDDAFLGFCLTAGEELDLEQGAWQLAATRYPEINVPAYQALLDSYAAELRERAGPAGGARAVLDSLNAYLFGELGFRGDEDNYYDPANSYLNQVMDRRLGNPISLCVVLLFLARRLHLPLVGIGMPGHYLCRYQDATEEVYIDAFHSGRLLSKADCVKYLMRSSYGFQEGLLAPLSPRRTLLRMCSNLHQIYLHLKQRPEVNRLQRYVVALAK